MKYVRRTPVEAFKWTGDIDQKEDPEWIVKAIEDGKVSVLNTQSFGLHMTIGDRQVAKPGYYIILNDFNKIESANPEYFEANYEEIT